MDIVRYFDNLGGEIYVWMKRKSHEINQIAKVNIYSNVMTNFHQL